MHKEPRTKRGSETRRATESHSTFLSYGCKHCGDVKYHDFKLCPNNEVKCGKCDMNGHSTEMCFSRKRVKEKTQRDKGTRNQSRQAKPMPHTWKRDRSASTAADGRRKSRRHLEYDTAPPRTQERERATNSPIRNNLSMSEGQYLRHLCGDMHQGPSLQATPHCQGTLGCRFI